MPYDPEKHCRRSIRLPEHDYTQSGRYFVTICVKDRHCLFGEVRQGRICLNACGRIAVEEWRRTAEVRDIVQLDAFVVMPNHVHGIIAIVGNNDVGATGPIAPATAAPVAADAERPCGPEPNSLGAIIGQYKSGVTKRIQRLWDTSRQTLWQRNYYEHIIRGRKDLERICRYIADNPARWSRDRYHTNQYHTTS